MISWAARSNETYVGGRETGAWGDRPPSRSSRLRRKSEGGALGRIRIPGALLPGEPRQDVAARSLIPFVQTTFWRHRPNRWLLSLQWSGRTKMTTSRDPFPPVATRPSSCHDASVAALLDRWWLGIHHGPSMPTISNYLDAIRFNRRRSQARGLLFFRLLQQAVAARAGPLQAPSRRSRSLGNRYRYESDVDTQCVKHSLPPTVPSKDSPRFSRGPHGYTHKVLPNAS